MPRTLHKFYTLKVQNNYIILAIKTKSSHSLYLPSTWKDKQMTRKKIIPKEKNTELHELSAAILFLHNVLSPKSSVTKSGKERLSITVVGAHADLQHVSFEE